MKIIRNIEEFNQYRNTIQKQKLGFIPTMGALHAGHYKKQDAFLLF